MFELKRIRSEVDEDSVINSSSCQIINKLRFMSKDECRNRLQL